MHINDYTLTYEDLDYYPTATREVITATMSVYDGGGRSLGTMTPSKTFHKNQEQPVTDVAIRTTLREDLYVILAGWETDVAAFKVYVNPLVVWIWIGGGVMLLGTVFAMWPDARERRRTRMEPSLITTAERGEQDET